MCVFLGWGVGGGGLVYKGYVSILEKGNENHHRVTLGFRVQGLGLGVF